VAGVALGKGAREVRLGFGIWKSVKLRLRDSVEPRDSVELILVLVCLGVLSMRLLRSHLQ
jgi:hypothetical protein